VSARERDGEDEQGRTAAALAYLHVADADARFVVMDGAEPLVVDEKRVRWPAEANGKGLPGLQHSVAENGNADRLAGFPRGEGNDPRCGRVIAPGTGCAVGGGVMDGNRLGEGSGEPDREDRAHHAHVALGDGRVTEGDARGALVGPVAVV